MADDHNVIAHAHDHKSPASETRADSTAHICSVPVPVRLGYFDNHTAVPDGEQMICFTPCTADDSLHELFVPVSHVSKFLYVPDTQRLHVTVDDRVYPVPLHEEGWAELSECLLFAQSFPTREEGFRLSNERLAYWEANTDRQYIASAQHVMKVWSTCSTPPDERTDDTCLNVAVEVRSPTNTEKRHIWRFKATRLQWQRAMHGDTNFLS